MKSAIDYRKYYTNFLIRCIEDKLKELSEISEMPEKLLEQKMIRENINIAVFKEGAGIK